MKYYISAQITEKITKRIKNLRFKYDRSSINKETDLIIARTINCHKNSKTICSFVSQIFHGVKAIKISPELIVIENQLLKVKIENNNKLNALRTSILKNNVFLNDDVSPYIPILNISDIENSESIINEVKQHIRRNDFFLRTFSVNHFDGKEKTTLLEINI